MTNSGRNRGYGHGRGFGSEGDHGRNNGGGYGHGRGLGSGGGHGKNRGGSYGVGGYCVCASCGAKVKHESGVKCTSIKCPECGHTMVREELLNEKR